MVKTDINHVITKEVTPVTIPCKGDAMRLLSVREVRETPLGK